MPVPQDKHILLTGATGFLGSHLCGAFLRAGQKVTALARPSKTETAYERVQTTLSRILRDEDTFQKCLDLLHVVEGDISTPGLGLIKSESDKLKATIDEVWHSAASLSFMEEDREDIFRMNYGGTQHVIDWTTESIDKRLHHVSTAYIAGTRTGIVLEDEINLGQGFKNPYEDSKCQSEIIINAAHHSGRISASIYRPSIVIGESTTGYVTHFHGVYAFIRGLWAIIERLRRSQKNSEVIQLPLRVLGSYNSTLNFVPIDYATNAMIAIGAQSSSSGSTYHLANPKGTPNRLWMDIVCDQLRVEGINLVDELAFIKTPMTKMEAFFKRQMAFYYQYLESEPHFDCSKTLEAISCTGIKCPEVTSEFAYKMTGWYIDRLNRKTEN